MPEREGGRVGVGPAAGTRYGGGSHPRARGVDTRIPNHDLTPRLKARAADLGFGLSGIAPATAADGFDRFAAWLDRGYAGEMAYLHKHRDERRHPDSVLDGVRSVLMVGMEYGREPADP